MEDIKKWTVSTKYKLSSANNSSIRIEIIEEILNAIYRTFENAEYIQLFLPKPVPHSDLIGMINYCESSFTTEIQSTLTEPDSADWIILHEIKNKILNEGYSSISRVEKAIELQLANNFINDDTFPEATEKFLKTAKLIETELESRLIGDFDKFEHEMILAKKKKVIRLKSKQNTG